MSLQTAEQDYNPMKALQLSRPKGYTVLNSTDKPYELTFGGNTFVIPPRNEITRPHPKFNDPSSNQFVAHSARYQGTDEFIPGSLIVFDLGVRKEGDKGEDGQGFEIMRQHTANEFLSRTFGVDEHGNYSGEPFIKGLSVLDADPDKANVLRADRAGRQRYKEWLLKNATREIRNYQDRCASAERAKLPPPPQSQELLQAKALLEEQDKSFRKTLFQEVDEEVQVVNKGIERPISDFSPEVAEISDERLVELMKERDLLMKPKVRKELSEEFTVRKRRVPKSKQTVRAKNAARKTAKKAKSDKILVPED